MRSFSVLLLALILMVPAVVVERRVEARFDFDDDPVEGNLTRPDEAVVGGTTRAKHSSLIAIRESFVPELVKSADDL